MKIGFIGLGNMASAIIRGIYEKFGAEMELFGYNPHREKAEAMNRSYGLHICGSNAEVVEKSEAVVLAVKPQVIGSVLDELREADGKIILSVIAGRNLEYLEGAFPNSSIARIMPNINAKVGASITGICFNKKTSGEEKQLVCDLFKGIGMCMEIEEKFAAIVGCIGGASPAFTYMYINALAEAALKAGMPKKMALDIAAQSVLGSAKMMLESDEHPMALADQVCSPGGLTVEGVLALQKLGFEHAVHEAVHEVLEKDKRV